MPRRLCYRIERLSDPDLRLSPISFAGQWVEYHAAGWSSGEVNFREDSLINRTQMVKILERHPLCLSSGTIHWWANEPEFPMPVGKRSKCYLYSRKAFEAFIYRKQQRIQETH